MGEVHRAHDRRLHRNVAVKFLRPDLSAQADARQRFEDEAHSAARLTHPNVVLVLDSGEHDGTPYLVMECLPGRTLKDEIREGPLDPARVEGIARDVVAGLAAAHEIGIVHRDVSPGNVMLTDTGRAKIGDFGIAKAAESQSVTVVGQVLGTPAYVAPERLRGEPATPASDVYGLGATLYEAVSGSPAFSGDSAIAIAQQVVSTQPMPLADVRPDAPAELVAIIDAAMDRDPARRPTAAELRDRLADASEITTTALPVFDSEATIAAPIVAPVAPPRRRFDERRVLIAAVLIAALVGLVLFAITDHSGSSGTPADANSPGVSTTTPVTQAPTTAATAPRVQATAPATRPQPVVRVHVGKGGKGKHGKG